MRHWLDANLIDERVRLLDDIIGILTVTITALKQQISSPRNSSTLREEPEIYECDPLDSRTSTPINFRPLTPSTPVTHSSPLHARLRNALAVAQDTPEPSNKKVKYSPYPKESFRDQVFFGDTRLYTSYSTDAGIVGCTLGLEERLRVRYG